MNLTNVMKNEQILAIANELSFHSVEDLVAQIGFGKISPKQVVGRLKPKLGITETKRPSLVGKMVDRFRRRKAEHGITVKGVSDVLIRFANCCHPLPGESVIGFITRGRGITIHNRSCGHIRNADPDRLVEISWEPSREDTYLARLRVTSVAKKGMLADISSIMTQKDANIVEAEVKTTMDKKGIAFFTIEVENYKQLHDIMGAIKKVKNVLTVERQ